ncbi:carbamoylphosphate synthase large subunit [Metabacillus crassostreae]|uniref:ATP-grasp domain-containing protein n=1 Tax=Metabacillus crassostreae TaxID=929098 RepID=UPI001EF82813|nr:ATP-grasp domain-containing protein [Metabacillus crassostreae]MBM7603192.1 carbamoylphosphate synthase large subunit [Metabacillus crassostreae]
MSIELSKTKKVLITGVRAPVSLHLCRMFKKAGYEVYAADSVSYAISKKSNSIFEFYLLPSPKYKTLEFIKALKKIIKQNNIDLLLPTCEEIFYIAQYRKELSKYCEVFVDDIQKLLVLHNKYKCISLLKNLGYKVPETWLLTNKTKLKDLENKVNGELVAKRVFSRFGDSVLFINSINELPDDVSFHSTWLLQEKIKGEQYCSYSIAKQGTLVAHTVYKTEFSAGIGATLSFEHHDRNDIELLVASIVKKLHFTGQISFDFIIDEFNRAIPIECNPRATSGLHLLDYELTDVITNENKQLIYPKKDSKEAIKLGLLLYGTKQIKSLKTFKRWMYILIFYKDITFRSYDKIPFFYQFVSIFRLWTESRRNKQNMLTQSTSDMNWDGEIL